MIDLPSPRRQGWEALVHSAIAALICLVRRPDCVHIHNIGPGLFCPLLRWRGIRVIVTIHSLNYRHEKWGPIGRAVLRFGERLCLRFAHQVIVVSHCTRTLLSRRYGRGDLRVIPNGVNRPHETGPSGILERHDLVGWRYILLAGRIAPEKGVDVLMEAFERLADTSVKLVIAGRSDHATAYAARIRKLASTQPNVILTGWLSEHELSCLYDGASLFVLPSYHEGLPIALLEALAHGVSVLCSDIPGNREVCLPPERYFPCGDTKTLARRLEKHLAMGPLTPDERRAQIDAVHRRFDWDRVAEMTRVVYERTLRPRLGARQGGTAGDWLTARAEQPDP